jgi:hypothetical protein
MDKTIFAMNREKKFMIKMEGILTQISDPNIVLQTITSQQTYLVLKPAERIVE